MKTAIVLFLLAAAAAAGPLRAQDAAETPAFLETLSDVPLMPGLQEIPDQGVVFDKPEGRIVESAAITESVDAGSISAFYNKTLPELGWKRTGSDTYVRGDETLEIAVVDLSRSRIVRFTVNPR